MNLTQQFTDYVHAAFTGLWVQTFEPDEAEREIAQLARQQDWNLATWDIANGLRFPNAKDPVKLDQGAVTRSACCAACPPSPSRMAPPCCCCTTSTSS
jgi:hypothetical protein